MRKLLIIAAAVIACGFTMPAAAEVVDPSGVCPAPVSQRCVDDLAANDLWYLRRLAIEQTAIERGAAFIEEATSIGENFSGLVIIVVPPNVWTPERRKQYGVEVANNYCRLDKLFFEHTVRVWLDDRRTFVGECQITAHGKPAKQVSGGAQ
jgi:hypothetical protein